MSNYIGVKCPVCGKKFTEKDDVVVCPICGAPHHRSCYAERGQCVFTDEHLDGKEWHAPQEEVVQQHGGNDQQPQTRACPSCGANNPAASIYCQICGARMVGVQSNEAQGQAAWSHPNYDDAPSGGSYAYGGLSPDEDIGGYSARTLATYVGPSAHYFLPRFHMQSKAFGLTKINFAALFFGYAYYFYRKMYIAGLILLALSIIGTIPYLLYLREMMPELLKDPMFQQFFQMLGIYEWPVTEISNDSVNLYIIIFNFLRIAIFIIQAVFSIFANSFYYRQAQSAIDLCFAQYGPNNTEYTNYVLAARGGISIFSVFLCYFLKSTLVSSLFYLILRI